jgi:hypothetical protein
MYDRPVNESARRAALVLLGASTLPRVAHAEEPGARSVEAASEPAVTFDSPKGCPDRDAFVAHVRARTRTGTLIPREPRAVTRLDVKVTNRGGSSAASVTVTDAEGRKGTRRITARSCREAVDGIALVTALTLDPSSPDAAAQSVASGPTPTAGAVAASATSAGDTTSASAASSNDAAAGAGSEANGGKNDSAAATESPGNADSSGTKPETPLKESPRARDPEGDQFPKLPLEPAKPTAPAEVRAGVLPSHLAAGLSMLGLTAPVPDLTPALEISGEWRTELNRLLDVGFRGALRISKGAVLSTEEGDAGFQWWAIAVGVCPGARTPTDTLSLALCAMLEQGQTHAEGLDTENPRSSRRSWTSLGPALRGRWALVPRAALEVGFDTLFPLRKDTFSLGATQVHEVPSVAFRFGAGVAFRFE